MDSNTENEAEKVREHIRSLYEESEKVIFTTDLTVNGWDKDKVESLLEVLDDQGFVRKQTLLHCPEDHYLSSVVGGWDPVEPTIYCSQCDTHHSTSEVDREVQYLLLER